MSATMHMTDDAGTPELVALLRDSRLFPGLDEAACRRLAAPAMTMLVARRTRIFEQGEMPGAQVIVSGGRVHLTASAGGRAEMLVETVRAPDLLLPAAVLEDSPYLLRAVAATECRLVLVPAVMFRAVAAAEPAVAQAVIACLARQFRRMTRQVKMLKLRTTTQRLAAWLLALRPADGGGTIELPYDKGMIAAELGMTRESLSRAFAALSGEVLTVEGARVRVRDWAGLEAVCPRDPLIDD